MGENTTLNRLGIKQFRVGNFLSYLLFDRSEKRAFIINPIVSLTGDYRSYLAQNHLVLSWVIVTLIGLGQENALELFPSEVRVNSTLADHLSIGSLKVAAFKSGQIVSLYSAGVLFLNDLDMIQSTVPSAFMEILKKLPGNTVIYPGFDERGLAFSILENEISGNIVPAVNHRVIEMGIEKYKSKLVEASSESLFIDVREQAEFLAGHIPSTRNLPLSEIGLSWAELKGKKKIYVSCVGGERSAQVVRTLNYLGLANVIHVKAGFRGWLNAGLPIERH
ncbi:MAG: rhodanese-like domain-containing protein [Bdellovibrionia bacterium]